MKETIRTNVSDCETSKTIDFKEHQTCPFYTADQRNGYNHQFLENDEETRIEKKGYNLIVFVLKGVLQLKTGHIIRKGTMYLWSEDENDIEGRAMEDSYLILLRFKDTKNLILDSMINEINGEEENDWEFTEEHISTELNLFLKLIDEYLNAQIYCQHLHDLKTEEFFRLLAIFYSKSQYTRFLVPLCKLNQKFRHQVINNYHISLSVTELAEKCHMSLRNFSRRFQEEFGTSPYKWMLEKKDKSILASLALSSINIQEIADEYGFSSLNHFSGYCKKRFNYPPLILHQELTTNQAEINNNPEDDTNFQDYCLHKIKL